MPFQNSYTVVLFVLMGCQSEDGIKVFNSLPDVQITSHSEDTNFVEGEAPVFIAFISDNNDNVTDLMATWYSGTEVICTELPVASDGIMSCQVELLPRWSDIRVQAVDLSGGAGSALININVVENAVPIVEIISPRDGAAYYSNQLLNFSGRVSDVEDDPEALISVWGSSIDGTLDVNSIPNSSGEFSATGYLSEGEHFISLETTDSQNKVGSDSETIVVGPPNSAPMCEILAPVDNSLGPENTSVRFEAMVSDADIQPNLLSVDWSSDKDGSLGASTPNSSGELVFVYDLLSVNTHTITMTVVDEVGDSCSDYIVYTVGTPPVVSLSSPLDGDRYNEGASITFTAEVSDNEDQPEDLFLSWVSDRDGAFSNQGANSSGVAQFITSQLSAGTHSITLLVTDSDALFSDDVLSITVNGLPTQPSVDLLPNPAFTTDDLLASGYGSVDPEGQAIGYGYSWYKNAVLQSNTGSVLQASQTTKGEEWTVRVTPNDGIASGPFTEESIVVSNALPQVSGVSISPLAPSTQDTLTCSAVSTDSDGDPVAFVYAWYKNGNLLTSSTQTLSGPFSQNDVLVCRVTPDDGFELGVYLEASVVVTNTAPSVSTLGISPSILYTESIATATIYASDPDGDPLGFTFEWYVDDGNGAQLVQTTSTLSTTDSLDGYVYFDRNDDVYLVVGVSDGALTTTETSQSFIVQNTPPSAYNTLVTPSAPIAGLDDILCSSQASDLDFDSVVVDYSWTVDGNTTNHVTDTISSVLLSDGEVWTCTSRPFDGLEYGQSISAAAIVGADNAAAVGGNFCSSAGMASNSSYRMSYCTSDESFVIGDIWNGSYQMQLGSITRVNP